METEKKLKYHITLTNNETGEVLMDHDTSAIIGAVQGPGDDAQGICAISCSSLELFKTINMTIDALKDVETMSPALYGMAEAFSKK